MRIKKNISICKKPPYYLRNPVPDGLKNNFFVENFSRRECGRGCILYLLCVSWALKLFPFLISQGYAAITESKMAWKIQIASKNDWGELRLFRIAHSVWAALSDVHFWIKSCLKPEKRPKSGAEQEEWAQRWLWSIFGSVRCLRWWWCCISLKSPKKEPGRGKQNYFHP